MPGAWDLSDDYLQTMLEQMTAWLAGVGDLVIALYKNDYIPVPGSDVSDFTEADFPGYAQGAIAGGDWGAVSVTTHVAQSTSGTVISFTGASGSWSVQTIYGYFVMSAALDYFFAERFSAPVDMSPDGEIRITPRLRHQNLPP